MIDEIRLWMVGLLLDKKQINTISGIAEVAVEQTGGGEEQKEGEGKTHDRVVCYSSSLS